MIGRLAAPSTLAIALVCGAALAQESGSEGQAAPPTRSPEPSSQGQGNEAGRQGSRGSQGAQGAQGNQGNQGQEGKLSAADRRFVEATAHANEDQIKLGELAKSKSQNDEVKRFGQRLIDDHTNANEQLKALAEKKGITLTAPPCSGEQSSENRLSKVPAERFDKDLLSEVMQGHLKEVADFQRETRDGSDPEVKQFAEETLPVLLEHERLVNDIRSEIGAPANNSSQKAGQPAPQGAARDPQHPSTQGDLQSTQGNSQNPQGKQQTPQGKQQNPRGGPQSPQGPQGAGKAPPPPPAGSPSTGNAQ